MISLLSLLLSIQLQAVGFEAGAARYLPATGFGPQVGVLYDHSICERFWISSGISYWGKRSRKAEGRRERNFAFSDLFFYEDGLVGTTFFDRLTLGAGVGISVHLLKNCVEERTDYGSVVVTDYYTRAVNRFGMRMQALAELKTGNILLALKAGYTALLMKSNGQNLFYEVGNIGIFTMTLGIGLRR